MASGNDKGRGELSPEFLRAQATRDADLIAVTEAISDMEGGDTGRPMSIVADEVRRKHGWSAD